MKTKILILTALMTTIAACGQMAPTNKAAQPSTNADPATPSATNPVAAGDGATVAGKGALSVPTADAIVVRLQNGLEKTVSPSAGNFARALAQVKANLPKVTNPLKATGYDQIQLLAYAACSDLTTGTTPIMTSKYNVTKAGTVANQQAALIAAGMRMVDQYVAGLASQSSATPKVNAALTTLVQQAQAAGNNSTIAFMSVCIAANTAGSSMMGF